MIAGFGADLGEDGDGIGPAAFVDGAYAIRVLGCVGRFSGGRDGERRYGASFEEVLSECAVRSEAGNPNEPNEGDCDKGPFNAAPPFNGWF